VHGSCYPTVRLLNKLFNTHIKSVEGQNLSFIIVHDYRAVTNPTNISDPDPNPNKVSCRISDPDRIIHKILFKT